MDLCKNTILSKGITCRLVYNGETLEPNSENEMNILEVEESGITEQAVEKSAMLYNRCVHLLTGPALTLHQSVTGETDSRSGGC